MMLRPRYELKNTVRILYLSSDLFFWLDRCRKERYQPFLSATLWFTFVYDESHKQHHQHDNHEYNSTVHSLLSRQVLPTSLSFLYPKVG